MLRSLLAPLLSLLALASMDSGAATASLQLKFDYAAADGFVRAVDREPLGEPTLRAIAAGRGSREMVNNTIKYIPGTRADGYLVSLRELASSGRLISDPFGLEDAVTGAEKIRSLLAAIRRDEQQMASRIARRLSPHWTGEAPITITVYLVIGGTSDGFVVDGETAPEFFIAIDKAGGDLAGLEQNITHESVHVMQRQLALRHCPQRTSIKNQPPVARFLETVYEEGVANYLADPGQITGSGDYIHMWRERYQRNSTPERIRENSWLYASLLDGLRKGLLTWDTAYQIGFAGSFDSRMYFVGREMARKRHEAGVAPLSAALSCRPETFFR